MKSTERPSKPPKQPKSNNLNPKLELIAYRPVEKQQETSQPDLIPSDEPPPQAELQAIAQNNLQNVYANDKPLPLEKPKAERIYADKSKFSSPPQPKQQRQFERSDEEPELPPEKCQHMQFLDCDSSVGSVIFECYHCQQGIISEYTGEPVMGEYKGRPSVVLAKVKCPNCGETAIRLQAREVLSTTAITSPWV